MPRLLTFCICRQAIVDREGGGLSLISLINDLTVIEQNDKTIPPDFNSPMEWVAATAWLRLEEDEGKTFEQRAMLFTPNGKTIETGAGTLLFDSTTETRIVTNLGKVTGFPVGRPGIVTVKIELREVDYEQEWKSFGDYPIRVVHQSQEGGSIATT